MPNIFQRIGGAIGRVFGREQQPVQPEPQQPQAPEPQRRGFGERLRDFFQPGRAERERLERERAEIEARAQEIAQRQRDVEAREQQLRDLRDRLAEQERQREEREREERERTQPRPATRPEQARPPVAPVPAPPLPDALRGIPAIMPLGPKGRDGAAYTTSGADEVLRRLGEAAALGQRVSLRVHDENGWHDLFLNEKSGPGRHKPAKGIRADYLAQFIGDDLEGWLADGCDLGEGETSDYEAVGEVDGYQLTVWS